MKGFWQKTIEPKSKNHPSEEEDEEEGSSLSESSEEAIINEQTQSNPPLPTSGNYSSDGPHVRKSKRQLLKKGQYGSFCDEVMTLAPPIRPQESEPTRHDDITGDDDRNYYNDDDYDSEDSGGFESNRITPRISCQENQSLVSSMTGAERTTEEFSNPSWHDEPDANDDDPMFRRVRELEHVTQELEVKAIKQNFELEQAKQTLENARAERRGRQRRCACLTINAAFVVGLVSFGIWFAYFREEALSSSQLFAARVSSLVDRLVAEYGLDQETLLTDGTPQNSAIHWLAQENHIIVEAMMIDDSQTQNLVERYAVAVFYYTTGGELWYDNDFFMGTDSVCNWQYTQQDDFDMTGISCNDDGLIVRLRLNRLGLTGAIPTEIALLSSLHSFGVPKNALFGTIPRELFHLKNLTYINLNLNGLNGTIPSELGGLSKDLNTVWIAYNELTGTIPSEMGSLTALTTLDFQVNDFTGTIPTEFGRLTDLVYLQLYGNSLTGTIPSEFRFLSTLRSLNIAGTNMTGNLDVICDDVEKFTRLISLVTDCSMDPPEVDCSCCTMCCDESGSTCIQYDL